jgi:oxaloacetate decarboxylase alpha subunit
VKRYQITVHGRAFDIRVLSDPRKDQVQVEVDGTALTVEAKSLLDQQVESAVSSDPSTRTASVSSGSLRAGMLAAPLPGEIKSISVRPGQHVDVGDELLVIEAMKMDNVIRAPRTGTISTVHVAEGHRIAHGEPLLDFLE